MVAVQYGPAPYSVLITDDDESCRVRFRDTFVGEGYDTHLADTGAEAIRIVRRYSVHVAVLDMHMRDMTGLDALCAIRQETNRNVPAVLVSHDTSKELRLKALAAHFETFLSKPVDLDILRLVVGRIVARHYGPGNTGLGT